MSALLLALILPAGAATPFAGLSWTPLSRGDLSWVDEDRTSGVAVGEFDGFVRPSLTAFGGAWLGDQFGLQASVGVARLQSTSWVGDVWRQRHWGVIRPAVDFRIGFGERTLRRPHPWLLGGVHGDIPSARDTSNGFTAEEQELADQNAAEDRARLGGIGARAGGGVDVRVMEGVALGAMWTVEWHRGFLRTDEALTVSSWMAADAALLLTFEWP